MLKQSPVCKWNLHSEPGSRDQPHRIKEVTHVYLLKVWVETLTLNGKWVQWSLEKFKKIRPFHASWLACLKLSLFVDTAQHSQG